MQRKWNEGLHKARNMLIQQCVPRFFSNFIIRYTWWHVAQYCITCFYDCASRYFKNYVNCKTYISAAFTIPLCAFDLYFINRMHLGNTINNNDVIYAAYSKHSLWLLIEKSPYKRGKKEDTIDPRDYGRYAYRIRFVQSLFDTIKYLYYGRNYKVRPYVIYISAFNTYLYILED